MTLKPERNSLALACVRLTVGDDVLVWDAGTWSRDTLSVWHPRAAGPTK